MPRFLISGGKFKSNKRYKDAFMDMGGNAYQVQWNQKWSVLRTAESR